MPHPKFRRVPHIFISYKREDPTTTQAVKKLIEQLDALSVVRLQDANSNCQGTYWIDEHMTGGDDWEKEIERNLEWCDIFIILVTDGALNSQFITNKEVPAALQKRKLNLSQTVYPIIVRTIDDEHLPEWLKATQFRPSGTVNSPESATRSRKRTLQDVIRDQLEDDFWITTVRRDLRKIIERVRDALRRKVSLEESTIKTIDVMTSVKGGVGKTLFSLALVYCHMSGNSRRVLAVDANTSNVDMWSFLHKSGMNRDEEFASEAWYSSPIYGDRYSKVLKKKRHARLFDGCQDFWEQITEMIASERRATAAIIDTNLMVGNVSYIENCRDAMRLITQSGIRVRLWFIWTFNALRENHFIERDITDIEEDAESGVEIIHILNPSALIPEKINPEPGRIEREQTATESDIQRLIKRTRKIAERHQLIPQDYLGDLKKLEQDSTEIYREAMARQPAFASHVHTPFEILRSIPPVARINFKDFCIQMEPLLQLLENIKFPLQGPEELDPIFDEWLKSSFVSGCPVNVVPFPYFNIRLKGYTDYVTQRPSTLKELGDFFGQEFTEMMRIALGYIEDDIQQ